MNLKQPDKNAIIEMYVYHAHGGQQDSQPARLGKHPDRSLPHSNGPPGTQPKADPGNQQALLFPLAQQQITCR